ncbi:AdoMet-homocysteine methyltransferase [Cladophialophora chaetospira]|uniref:AdoMet-homocysteine methyltransferase n=1 Tax=Cladophialophora chaetospira TaxID=386627 RepID=A0AA38X9Y9_9EURO|nr:AdoMet-homocysteine methyltransferase [Cladophialophora chaetospira]
MRNTLLEKSTLLLDGGLGTTLEDEHGLRFSSETPLWSSHLLVENVDTLKTVQRDFAAAGADIILTATYQASFHGFRNTKLKSESGFSEDEARRYMLSAVTIAREAFDGRPGLVALSLGAYGATMVPSTEYSGEYGNMREEDLHDFHLERLLCFKDSPEWKEVDIIAVETLPRLDEVRAAKTMMQEVNDKPYWISCVFPKDDENLPDGTSVEDLVKIILEGERPPFAIGINCTKVHKLSSLIKSFEDAARAQKLQIPRLVIYPDGAGGKVYDTALQQWIGGDESRVPWEKQVNDIVKEVQARGLWQGILVGGCCKTTPKHIRQLRRLLRDER